MRRFALALFFSVILHAALLALLRGGGIESVPRGVMRISLAALPGGGGEDSGSAGVDNSESVPVSANKITPASQLPQPTERAVTSVPARQVRTPAPRPGQPKVNEPLPQKAPNRTAEKNKSSPVQTGTRASPPSTPAAGNEKEPGDKKESGGAGRTGGIDSGASAGQSAVIDASRLRVTKKVPAEYPMISRRRKDQGTVVLLLSIRAGRVTKAEIEKSSGHAPLDESAKKAVSAWEFDTSGFGESLSARISFVFSLTGSP